jgi:ABC-type phosphate transport system permease subunit
MFWQDPEPFIVTVTREPARALTLGDVILGSLGLVGVMLLASVLLGACVALLLVKWHRRHPPEDDHLPPVSPLVPD